MTGGQLRATVPCRRAERSRARRLSGFFSFLIARGRSVEFAGGEIPLRRKDAGERMDTDDSVGVVDSTVGQGERL